MKTRQRQVWLRHSPSVQPGESVHWVSKPPVQMPSTQSPLSQQLLLAVHSSPAGTQLRQ